MARIFLSYRRDDSSGYAGRLYDRLSQHFGRDHLFMDVNIEYGLDFVNVIETAVRSCEVLLAVIGRQWLTSTDPLGHRRLDNPEDFVRIEIMAALARNIRVIPVLVGGASMPRSTELPDVLQPLARRQALVVGDYFHPDVDRLITALKTVLGTTPFSREQAAEPSMASSGTPPRDTAPIVSAPTTPHMALEPSFTNSIGMEFVLIPAGTFMMGSPDSDREADVSPLGYERPAHRVTISQPFYLGKYLVTQAQWEVVMGNNPSYFKGKPNCPVEHVSWNDVQAFLHKLNEREKDWVYCLPTEAQWEYACRAGTEAPRYHPDVNAIAWYEANSNGQLQPVGLKLPNVWGLYDMLGNVREWCHDGRRTYTADAVVDPIGLTAADAYRVARGGCGGNSRQHVRADFRSWYPPDIPDDSIGFRCASSGRPR